MNVSYVYAYVFVLTMISQSFKMNKIHFLGNDLIIYLSCFWEQIPQRISLKDTLIFFIKSSINKSVFSGREIGDVTVPLKVRGLAFVKSF